MTSPVEMTRARLYRLFHENADDLARWLDLANRPDNPHRVGDLLTAAENVGRVELLAALLKEQGDPDPDDEAEALAAEYDRIRSEVFD